MAAKAPQRRSARGEYIETETGNKISRRAKIEGTPHIILGGRVVVQAGACLRGDLCRLPNDSSEIKENTRNSISVGKYTVISTDATLHPPYRFLRGELTYYAMKIGEHVYIGPSCYISAASIGSHVHIGAGTVIGIGCIIKDSVKILEGSVLAAGMVVPSGVVVGGQPATIVDDLPDGWGAAAPNSQDGEWVEGGELRALIRTIK